MLQKTLITVGASLTAVVLLLFMIQRKKPRQVAGKGSEGSNATSQANNNEDANGSNADTNSSIKSDINEKAADAVTIAPNGVVVKKVGNSKNEESTSLQSREKDLESLVQKLSKVSSVELVCQKENVSEKTFLQEQTLVQPEPFKTPVSEPALTQLNFSSSELVTDLSAEQLQKGLPVGEPVIKCSIEQVLVGWCSEEQESKHLTENVECSDQQHNSISEDPAVEHQNKFIPEVQTSAEMLDDSPDFSESSVTEIPVQTSSEDFKPEDSTSQSQTISDLQMPGQSTDVSKSPKYEPICVDAEQESNDTDKEEGKLKPVIVAKNSESSCSKVSVDVAGEQQSVTDNSSSTNLQIKPEHSNVGEPVHEPSLSESEQSNGESLLEPTQLDSGKSDEPIKKASLSESGQPNGKSLQEPSQLDSGQSNEEDIAKSSHSVSGQSNGKSLQEPSHSESQQSNEEDIVKGSHSESGQSNGEPFQEHSESESEQSNSGSTKKPTNNVEQSNGGSNEPGKVLEHYYDNHKAMVSNKPSNASCRGDYRKLWPQPQDGLIFVKSSAGQPLVPQYLRDPEYLSTRTIPVHDPATTALLYASMNKLVHPPENWVRVISVSENLELRVRHDERDMLLEHLEKKGVCDPYSKPPPPRLLTVGSLVAAHLEVPRRGMIWCRAHITAVLPVTGPSGRRKGRQPQPQHQPQPLFMVESIDHFPAASAEPLRASDLRPLAAHAMHAPFYDQMFYLINTMPADAAEYGSNARDMLLEQLRAGQNFLRVTGPASCTVVSGAGYWMASLAAVQTTESGSAVCLLEETLQNSEHAMPIYTGRVLDGLPFNKCIFRDGEAFWSDDDRCPSSLELSCGPPNPQQEYLWLRRTDPRIIQAFRGFKLPYKHANYQFKRLGFSMSLHEYYTVYRHHSSTVLLTAEPDKVLKVVLDDPQALVILDFHMQTLIRFYHFDPNLINDPEAHVAKDNTPMHMLSFPKDDNGFLILGNTFFSDFTKENLRIPIMPF